MKYFSIFLFFFTSLLEANYCIQVATVAKSDRNSIVQKASSTQYADFNDVHVEARGNHLVFRIGDYPRYKDAISDSRKVKSIVGDAYIRKCDFIPEKAVYIRDTRQKNTTAPAQYAPSYSNSFQNYSSTPMQEPLKVEKKIQKPKKAQKKRYKKKGELQYNYPDEKSSLWGDCKKCFIPVYEEEEEEIDYKLPSVPQQQEKVKKQKVPSQKQESFWAEDMPVVKDATPKVNRVNKPRNKFNIDEQFLP